MIIGAATHIGIATRTGAVVESVPATDKDTACGGAAGGFTLKVLGIGYRDKVTGSAEVIHAPETGVATTTDRTHLEGICHIGRQACKGYCGGVHRVDAARVKPVLPFCGTPHLTPSQGGCGGRQTGQRDAVGTWAGENCKRDIVDRRRRSGAA